MRADGVIDQRLHLRALAHVHLHDGVAAEVQLLGQGLQAVQPPRAQHHLGARLHEVARGFSTQAAAGSGDDDDFACDVLCHVRLLYFKWVLKNVAILSKGILSMRSYKSTWSASGTMTSSLGSPAALKASSE